MKKTLLPLGVLTTVAGGLAVLGGAVALTTGILTLQLHHHAKH